MFASSKTNDLVAVIFVAIFILAAGAAAHGQCTGVFLRPMSTTYFPYQKVYLDQAADMNGDGKADLLISQDLAQNFARDRIFILPNNGNATFGAPIVIEPPSGKFSSNYFVGKVNNDALNDIIAYPDFGGGFDPPTLLVYLNNGNGTFSAPVVSSGGNRGRARDLVDVNNDGKNDYITYSGSSVFSYSLGNGDGTFQPLVPIYSNGGISSPVDFNNDGKIDFFGFQNLYTNNGNGTFAATSLTQFLGPNESAFLIRDLNGDGRTDILASTSEGTFRRMLRRVDGGFDSTTYPGAGPGIGQPLYQSGFYNGDAYIDIIVSFRNENRKVLLATDATGALTRSEMNQRFFNYNFHKAVYGDFDGDGREDLIQMQSGITNSNVMFTDGSSYTFLKNVACRPGQPRIVDFDASGNTDFSFWNPATGDWSWKANSYDQETNATETVNWGLGSLGDIPAPGDFDGDGVTDRAVFRNSTGVWYIRKSSDSGWFVLPFGVTGDKPVVADYDGDSVSDIAVWRPSDGNWYIWYMGTQQFAALHFGTDGDRPAHADFDGDLKTDIAVYRPSSGVWYYLKSSNGQLVTTGWGSSEDKPIAADYDGDGKADIAVFRDSNRFVYMIRSVTSTAEYYWLGYPGSVAQIGDYDGDFIMDLGWYEPQRNFWLSYTDYGASFGVPGMVPVSSMIRVE